MLKPEKEAEEEEEGKGRYEIGKAGACTSFCGTETNRPYGERAVAIPRLLRSRNFNTVKLSKQMTLFSSVRLVRERKKQVNCVDFETRDSLVGGLCHLFETYCGRDLLCALHSKWFHRKKSSIYHQSGVLHTG